MYSLEYVDESMLDASRKQFTRVYPGFRARPLGASQDRKAVIIECEFPDGTYYFRVTEDSVSHAYTSQDAADRA